MTRSPQELYLASDGARVKGSPSVLVSAAIVLSTLGAGVMIGTAFSFSPAVAFGTGLLAVLLWILSRDLYRGLVFLLFVTVLIPHNVFYRVSGIAVSPGRVSFILIIGLLTLYAWQKKSSLRAFGNPLTKYLFLYVSVMFLSVVINGFADGFENTGQGMKTTLSFLVDYVLLFHIAYLVVQRSEKVDVTVKLVVLLITVSAAVGIAEFVTKKNLFFYLQQYVHLSGETQTWAREYLEVTRERGSILRSSGTFDHILDFAAALTITLPLSFHCYFSARGWRKFLYFACAVTISAGLVLTLSRGAYLAAFAVLFIYSVRVEKTKVFFQVLFLFLLALLIFFSMPGVSSSFRDIIMPAEGITEEGSFRGRLDDYGPMADIVKEQPFWGLGPGMLLRQLYHQQNRYLPETFDVMDNYYLVVAGETGMVGLLCFLMLYQGIYRNVRPAGRRAGGNLTVSNALFASCCGYFLLTFVFDSLGFFGSAKLFWMIAAMGVISKSHTNGTAMRQTTAGAV